MEYGKYIIVDAGSFEQAILFENTLQHVDFIDAMFKKDSIVSAGFFEVGANHHNKDDENDIGVSVFGKSVTLNIEARKGKDERLIKRILRKEYY